MNNTGEYLTVTAIAQQLHIPDSTIRYYIKNHSEYLPAKGEGRKKRYSSECVEVLRMIAEGYSERKTAAQINEELSALYSRIIESQALTTTAQQVGLQEAITDISRSLAIIANQQQEIDDLKARIERLEQTTTKPQQGFIGRLFRL